METVIGGWVHTFYEGFLALSVLTSIFMSIRNGRKADKIVQKVEEVHGLTNGNIEVIRELANRDANARVAASEAAAMEPANIAAAAQTVKDAAYDAHEELTKD